MYRYYVIFSYGVSLNTTKNDSVLAHLRDVPVLHVTFSYSVSLTHTVLSPTLNPLSYNLFLSPPPSSVPVMVNCASHAGTPDTQGLQQLRIIEYDASLVKFTVKIISI